MGTSRANPEVPQSALAAARVAADVVRRIIKDVNSD